MRPAAAGVVLGLAVAIGTPVTWQLTREPEAAGAPVEQALPEASPAPPSPGSPTPQASASPGWLPEVAVRDAAPTATPERPEPTWLTVTSLGIDAPLDPVGVAADGQMLLPEDVSRVGWYRFGPAPGEEGSAVLAGHVDDRDQGLGALAALREVEPGSQVVVTDEAGTQTRWRVVSRELIHKQVLPLDRIFSEEGAPRLVLVTCGGPFLAEYGSYRDNVVVVAQPLP
ncbi:class F sortase [Geodermatophilus sp. DF01-2]|uniref:class F sortase n=1 Tax=Geodermatophilus sp. DF01-2 TaxID=2559610 RepID=UPI0010742C0D|nr:class F sortase [Geodermatophilus sp. DF01_2]TFV53457.1 class F sortase [Geodermatophilus sp. DF01_2]